MPHPTFLIAGGGLTGAKAAQTLREEDFPAASRWWAPNSSRPTRDHRCPRPTSPAAPDETASTSTAQAGTTSTTWSCDWAARRCTRHWGGELDQMFADLHRDHNVDLRLRTRVHEFTSSGGHAGRVVAGMNVNVWDVTPAIQP